MVARKYKAKRSWTRKAKKAPKAKRAYRQKAKKVDRSLANAKKFARFLSELDDVDDSEE